MNTPVKRHPFPLLPNLPPRRQAGGTFLGLILGLIIGLGIAVAVALMITRSPIPFIGKVGKQERTGLSSTQVADPNKPLYGNKDIAREAPPAPKEPEQNRPEPDDTSAPPATTDLPKMSSSREPSEKSGAAAEDKWIYFLQTGAFRGQAEAESARARLALLGFEARVSERPSATGDGSLFRVRIGPIGQLEAVNRMRGSLSDVGIDAAIVRLPK